MAKFRQLEQSTPEVTSTPPQPRKAVRKMTPPMDELRHDVSSASFDAVFIRRYVLTSNDALWMFMYM